MARELILKVTDDFNGEPADEQCVLGWEGYNYALDLTSDHYKELHELLEPWLEAAHEKTKQKKQVKQKVPAKPAELVIDKPDRAERDLIRTWARENGHDVGDKGVIAKAIVEAYREANK